MNSRGTLLSSVISSNVICVAVAAVKVSEGVIHPSRGKVHTIMFFKENVCFFPSPSTNVEGQRSEGQKDLFIIMKSNRYFQ